MWHLLQLSDAVDREFAYALAESLSLTAWEPRRCLWPLQGRTGQLVRRSEGPNLDIVSFPIVRGYSRFPISRLVPTNRLLLDSLIENTVRPEISPLICTTPYFAEVAERWPGPVVYWLTDLIAAYESADPDMVVRLDRRLCKAAALVCPNSQRIAEYLVDKAGCDPARIHVLPNGVRAQNLQSAPPFQPTPLPPPVAGLRRPIAGVIGNMAGNHDWITLAKVVESTPEFSWLFVGPKSMPIPDRPQRRARALVMRHPRCTFIGKRPYAELVTFSRALDVAVLPYAGHEPTSCGSSTRFYEHLAACRPMIAFPGVTELLSKAPLVSIVHSAEQAISQLESLRRRHFDDGLSELRWRTAHGETWQARAQSLERALAERLGPQHVHRESNPEVALTL